MKVVEGIGEVRAAVAAARAAGAGEVGFVPTMGALHAGHYSLIDAAGAGGDFVVVSIFVNPTQFDSGEDLDRYPRTLAADLAGCAARGVDLVFTPGAEEMYPSGAATTVHVAGLTDRLCGASRPGHFDGVCTVVSKLLNIVRPDAAYFGEKDYQQAAVVRQMAADLNMPVRIVVGPTVREPDGLAMSSRNARLSPSERAQAAALYEALQMGAEMVLDGRGPGEVRGAMRRRLAERAPSGEVDYVEMIDPEGLERVEEIGDSVLIALAVRFPSARLIDNIRVDLPDAGP